MGSFIEKLKAFFKYSETLLWARVVMLLGVVSGVIEQLMGWDVIAFVPPKWQWVVLVVFGLVTELVRRRGGSRDPITNEKPDQRPDYHVRQWGKAE